MIADLLTPVIDQLRLSGSAKVSMDKIPYKHNTVRQSLYLLLKKHKLRGSTRISCDESGNILLFRTHTDQVAVAGKPFKVSAGLPATPDSRPSHQLITDQHSNELIQAYKFLLSEGALYGVEITGIDAGALELLYPGLVESLKLMIENTKNGVVLT
jgi:hypothetical protein